MRLMQVLEPSGGGSGRHFIDLCRGMQARGHVVHAVYSPLRAEAIGIPVAKVQWLGFVLAAAVAGLAGALFAFSKGSISPETMSVAKSVDGLVMVLLGGVQTLVGPIVGAFSFTWLHDAMARNTDYWRAALGGIVLLLVLLFPRGMAGYGAQLLSWLRNRQAK